MTDRRSLIPRLPRRAWVVLSGDALSALGTGLTLPFLIVYLHRVRGIDLEVAGLALSTIALAGFAGNPLGGWLTDRVGARFSLIVGLSGAAAGAFLLVGVTEPWHAFVATATVGLGEAIIWPSLDSLLATTVSPRQRSAVFSARHATINAGFGIGGLIAASIADIASARTFQALYVVDGLSFLAFIPILLASKDLGKAKTSAEEPTSVDRGNWRTVFKDRVFVRLWVLTALLVGVGYAQMNSSFPAYATGEGGLSAGQLAIVFTANTFVVVFAQLVTLRVMTGRKRTTALVLVSGFWAVSWALVLVAGEAVSGAAVPLLFAGASVVFALGETLLSPSVSPMVNDLAPEQLRGRYNGAFTLAWTTGFFAGPAVAGLALARGFAQELFVGLIASCGLAAVMAARLRRLVPAEANLIEAGDDTAGPEAADPKGFVVPPEDA